MCSRIFHFKIHGGTADKSGASRVKWAVKKLQERVAFIDVGTAPQQETSKPVDKPHLGMPTLLTKKTTPELKHLTETAAVQKTRHMCSQPDKEP